MQRARQKPQCDYMKLHSEIEKSDKKIFQKIKNTSKSWNEKGEKKEPRCPTKSLLRICKALNVP